VFARQGVSSEKSKKAHAVAQTASVQSEITKLAPIQAKANDVAALQAEMQQLLGTDVSWTKVVHGIGAALPNGVLLTGFQASETQPTAIATTTPATGTSSGSGTSTTSGSSGGSTSAGAGAGAATTPLVAAPTTITGSLSFTGFAPDFPTLAAWMDKTAKAPGVGSLTLGSAQRSTFGTTPVVTFTATATLTDGARSDRLQTFIKGAQ